MSNEALGAPPAGTPIEISHTKELEVGDKIHITFPGFSKGRLNFGSEATFSITNKKDDGAAELYVPPGSLAGESRQWIWGTKDDVLKKLASLSSYNSLTVIRPPEVMARLEDERRKKGIPAWQGPMLPPEPTQTQPAAAAAGIGIPWIPIAIGTLILGGVGTAIYLRKKGEQS